MAMVLMSCRNCWTASVSPVMSMPASDPAKIKAVSAWVVAVIVTSAGAGRGVGGERPVLAVVFGHVVRAVEPEVPAGRLVIVGG